MKGGLYLRDVGDGPSLATLIHIKSGAGAGAAHNNLDFKKNGTSSYKIDVNGLVTSTSGDQYHYTLVDIGDVAADSDAIDPGIYIAGAGITLYRFWMSVDTAIGADAVNYQSFDFIESSGGLSILSSPFTSVAEWVAGTFQDMGALAGGPKVLIADETVKMTITKTVGGKAMSGVRVMVQFTCTS